MLIRQAIYDNYMQDPTTQQGFNRYAYCMYNPLKYIDPTGEQYFGWDPSLSYRMEQEARAIVRGFTLFDNSNGKLPLRAWP